MRDLTVSKPFAVARHLLNALLLEAELASLSEARSILRYLRTVGDELETLLARREGKSNAPAQ